MNDFIFGVFQHEGKLVFALGRTTCSPTQAEIVVGILDAAKCPLEDGHYFAYDYAENALKNVVD